MSSRVYYRNRDTIYSDENVEVDPGSLWELKDDLLILVDDDEYVSLVFNKKVERLFELEK